MTKKRKRIRKLWVMGSRKPRFAGTFARHLAAALVIAVLSGVAATGLAAVYYREKCQTEFDADISRCMTGIKEAYNQFYADYSGQPGKERKLDEEEKWQRFLTCAKYQLGFLEHCEAALYNADTGEVCADSDSAMYIFVKNAGTEIYKNDGEPWENVREEQKKLYRRAEGVTGKDGADKRFEVYMEEVYLKDGNFVPGRLEVIKGLGENEETLAYDFTPEDKENYEYVPLSREGADGVLGPVWYKAERDGELVQRLEEFIASSEEDEFCAFGSPGTWNIQEAKTFTLGKSLNVRLFMAGRYRMFESCGTVFFRAYAGLFGLALLLALLVSCRVYWRDEAYYEMETYRRQTADAMAHDLKSPLAAISVFAENLENQVHTEKREYYAAAILENVRYMNDLIEHILELARTEGMARPAERSPVDLEPLIWEQLGRQEAMVERKKIRVTCSGSGTVLADKMQMVQIVDNLVSNAVKYTKPEGCIFIRLTENGLEMVNDMEGEPGVAKEELWKPFVKGDNSRSGKKGNGIGLAIVKNLVEGQDGRAELEVKEGKFSVRLLW